MMILSAAPLRVCFATLPFTKPYSLPPKAASRNLCMLCCSPHAPGPASLAPALPPGPPGPAAPAPPPPAPLAPALRCALLSLPQEGDR